MLFDGSQFLPSRPSDRKSMKIRDVRMIRIQGSRRGPLYFNLLFNAEM